MNHHALNAEVHWGRLRLRDKYTALIHLFGKFITITAPAGEAREDRTACGVHRISDAVY